MSKILSIKFLLLTNLKKKEKELDKDRFEEICKSLRLIKENRTCFLTWEDKKIKKKMDINISDFKIYSRNKSGDTKETVNINEVLAKKVIDKILSFN